MRKLLKSHHCKVLNALVVSSLSWWWHGEWQRKEQPTGSSLPANKVQIIKYCLSYLAEYGTKLCKILHFSRREILSLEQIYLSNSCARIFPMHFDLVHAARLPFGNWNERIIFSCDQHQSELFFSWGVAVHWSILKICILISFYVPEWNVLCAEHFCKL